jgi:hypothetical protein
VAYTGAGIGLAWTSRRLSRQAVSRAEALGAELHAARVSEAALDETRKELLEALGSATEAFHDKAAKLSDAEDLVATLDESLGCLQPLLTQAVGEAAAEKGARRWLEACLRSERGEAALLRRAVAVGCALAEEAVGECAALARQIEERRRLDEELQVLGCSSECFRLNAGFPGRWGIQGWCRRACAPGVGGWG